MLRLIAFFGAIWIILIAADANAAQYCQAKNVSNKYDRLYRAAVFKYYPLRFNTASEWCWVKAQAVTESGQDPDAVSPVGAMGVLQLMPGTLDEMATQYGMNPRAYHARTNIQLGVAYMARLFKFWHVDRTKQCHREVAQASYNCGPGCVLKAQVKADGAPCLDRIAPYLPRETREYGPKIAKIHEKLDG